MHSLSSVLLAVRFGAARCGGASQVEGAAAAGLELVQHRLTAAETMATFREYVATRRMPLLRLGPVGVTALARRARAEGVRTVLSGEGADEVFCGYDSARLIAARAGLFGLLDGLCDRPAPSFEMR